MVNFVRHLLDGPVRTRAFWGLVFLTAVKFAELWGVDLGGYEAHVDAALMVLVTIGILRATRSTTEVDEIDQAWSIETLAKRQEEREAIFERMSKEEIEGSA